MIYFFRYRSPSRQLCFFEILKNEKARLLVVKILKNEILDYFRNDGKIKKFKNRKSFMMSKTAPRLDETIHKTGPSPDSSQTIVKKQKVDEKSTTRLLTADLTT